ncbi:MAG TPA: IDEAL domain-containing protein [Pseudogracilibacillus sp.]|nr:IDEAL domain-containing protein [Pseudogracilibacillus sp.]
MKKERTVYKFYRYAGKAIVAKKDTPFEMKLQATLLLDDLCYTWNKEQLQRQLDEALDRRDRETFMTLSEKYRMLYHE